MFFVDSRTPVLHAFDIQLQRISYSVELTGELDPGCNVVGIQYLQLDDAVCIAIQTGEIILVMPWCSTYTFHQWWRSETCRWNRQWSVVHASRCRNNSSLHFITRSHLLLVQHSYLLCYNFMHRWTHRLVQWKLWVTLRRALWRSRGLQIKNCLHWSLQQTCYFSWHAWVTCTRNSSCGRPLLKCLSFRIIGKTMFVRRLFLSPLDKACDWWLVQNLFVSKGVFLFKD